MAEYLRHFPQLLQADSGKMLFKQGCTNPRRQVTRVTKVLQWHIMFVGPKYGSYFMSPF
jgi:hypothetical protein